ncbi:unnamed protein product [Vitrella brassicaformis CCMP3155]|uniref:Uncharacterized protein n=1 Tax=Vitrella brassicaformis (strain CCMP3155) TaxID=1169540 RepID=A0A0G4EX28_VITBC|nr:unnamed protein product [Vitrella brassicaformis CCMP3155]|eukprot:CEM03343.1 unnamed protein product [Vitrella brassicaformis CCMP3155]
MAFGLLVGEALVAGGILAATFVPEKTWLRLKERLGLLWRGKCSLTLELKRKLATYETRVKQQDKTIGDLNDDRTKAQIDLHPKDQYLLETEIAQLNERIQKAEEEHDEAVWTLNPLVAAAQSRNAAIEDLEDHLAQAQLRAEVASEHMNEGQLTCTVCMEGLKTHAFIPCGHRQGYVRVEVRILKTQGDEVFKSGDLSRALYF